MKIDSHNHLKSIVVDYNDDTFDIALNFLSYFYLFNILITLENVFFHCINNNYYVLLVIY